MIHRILSRNRGGNESLIHQMHQLRARQFSERRGWRVDVRNGYEFDRFDDMDPLYIVVSDGEDQLLASLRLLPTTGPHMLSDVFPEVMGKNAVIRHPLIWESSRFCVDTRACREFGEDMINTATRELLRGLFETAEHAGMENIVSVYDLYVERILKRSGCIFDRIGEVVRYDDLRTTAGIFEVSQRVIQNLADRTALARAV
ncbi:MAG: acyl-homoserine-lactone synthase [Hyphomicrobiales bacterium]